MESDKEKRLRELLEKHHDWPDTFMFKFIYKADPDTEKSITNLFTDKAEFSIKSSSKNNFNSMTVKMLANSSEDIFKVYSEASKIEGVISL